MTPKKEILHVAGREVAVTNPEKVFFPKRGHTKLDLVRYYLAVADGALRGIRARPMLMKRYVNGAGQDPFFQKRAPTSRPSWIEVATLSFPSGRTADEVVARDAATLAWVVNLGCIDLNPHPVRAEDLDHPDELRIDLDPQPKIPWSQIRDVAYVTREVLADLGLVGFPKTSGSRGMHVYVRIAPRWSFDLVRRAAVAIAREVERRAPSIATAKWWKEERHGVFLDYNQNAKDRTVASAYSVRPTEDARVSMPLDWAELESVDPADFTLETVPALFASRGDRHATIDDEAFSLEKVLALAAEQERGGEADAPWPPHYAKQAGEPARVMPSRAKKPAAPKRAAMPLIVVARAQKKDDALEGLERWKARYPAAAAKLGTDDVLVDAMRGRFTTWTRIRVNLRAVPEDERPPQEPPDPDWDPASEWRR
ncbi:MAG: non-homologous end-joining DNA ligase [Deltaproteobacteria bacterium]|nr:non-homologous end-joining DNA ligase [Deltaproteobacteria bacterium]